MSNIEIRFKCKSEPKDWVKVESFNDNIVLVTSHEDGVKLIHMDISTAIKFAKTLRTEINKIKEPETLKQGDFTTLTRKPKKGGSNG